MHGAKQAKFMAAKQPAKKASVPQKKEYNAEDRKKNTSKVAEALMGRC